MRVLRTIAELGAALAEPRRQGHRIGLVPTMGAFHPGHLALMHAARSDCDDVVVSLFVNPTQFNARADLTAYPRDEQRDALLAAEAGVDLLFVPAPEEIYPAGFATRISVGGLTGMLEGAKRGRDHFDGVTTVVLKLFNIVAPHVAYFGHKDVQQTLVIKQMARDLNVPVHIEVLPTVREPDGLAMSSRNVHLSPAERQQALALSRSLSVASALVAAGETDALTVAAAAQAELDAAGVETEYFQIVNSQTLLPIKNVEGPVLAVVAARVGSTRLIDNQQLSPDPTGSRPPLAAGSNPRSA